MGLQQQFYLNLTVLPLSASHFIFICFSNFFLYPNILAFCLLPFVCWDLKILFCVSACGCSGMCASEMPVCWMQTDSCFRNISASVPLRALYKTNSYSLCSPEDLPTSFLIVCIGIPHPSTALQSSASRLHAHLVFGILSLTFSMKHTAVQILVHMCVCLHNRLI